MSLIIHQRRGVQIEGVHPVAAVRVDPAGTVIDRIGEPVDASWRSAAKPIQLEANLSLLDPALVADLSDADLAVGAASHSAQPMHVDRVLALLRRLDRTPDHLFCGAHRPVHSGADHALVRERQEPSALHNNCSGKHTFMAAGAAQLKGAPDYRDPAHPLQVHIRALVEARCDPHLVKNVSIDGCGVPTFNMSIDAMATAWAQMAAAMNDEEALLGRIGWAMNAHPELVSGTDRQDLAQMLHATEPITTKVGAMGLSCIAIPGQEEGIAIKVLSGNPEARAIAVQAVLEHWYPGLLPLSATDPWRIVTNCVQDVVGERRAEWRSG